MSLGGGNAISGQTGFRFTTDGGIPIGMGNAASASTMQNRSQTSVGGNRLNINRAHLNSLQNYGT